MSTVTLRVRKTPKDAWLTNFSSHAWTIVDQNGNKVKMTPYNTKVRSADGTTWLNVK